LLACGIVSSVLYIATDIIGTLRYPGYSWLDQEFSELTAQGSPVRTFMVASNGIPYTVLMLALAAGLWLMPVTKQRHARLAAAGLAGYAIVGFAGGVLTPMATREAMAAGEDTLRNTLHAPVTFVMSLSLMVGMGFAATLREKPFRYYTYSTIATLIAFGILTSLQVPEMGQDQPTPLMGLEERVNIYATMLWLAVLPIALLRAERSSASRTRENTPVAPVMLPR
jgi:hypothetical protein